MSSASTFGSPISRPSAAAPSTPLDGPHSTIVIGIALTRSSESTPQLDCMTYSWPSKPSPATPSAQPLQVALGDRLDVARQHGRVRALVLAPLARDLVRGDRADLRPQPLHLGQHRLLVRRVRVRVQQADRDRLDALGPEVVEDRRQLAQVERRALGAGGRQPAADLAAQVARHERRRLLVEQVEEVGPVAARDLQAVAEPRRRDQAGRDALALGQRVDDHGRAVREHVEPARRDAGLARSRRARRARSRAAWWRPSR